MKHKLLSLDETGVKFYEGKQGLFSGYASVFGGIDSYGDTIFAGAYKKTIADRERPIQMRWNHYGDIIGKWTRMEEDETGLYVEGELTPGHSKAMDVYASLMHGAISGLSIGYRPKKFVENEKGGLDLYEIDLVEISVVESPADNNAHISRIKNDLDDIMSMKELEATLRDVMGVSKSEAKAIIAKARNLGTEDLEIPQCDAVVEDKSEDELALAIMLRARNYSNV
jgi:HK97 family phage prohead protease